MRSIRVKGELKSLPEEHAAWFFTASCGQGPTVCSTLAIGSSSTSSVDVPFSSPSLSEGELTLQLRALRSEEDTARGEAGVLIASRKVVMATSKSTLTTELRLKPSAGDLLETVKLLVVVVIISQRTLHQFHQYSLPFATRRRQALRWSGCPPLATPLPCHRSGWQWLSRPPSVTVRCARTCLCGCWTRVSFGCIYKNSAIVANAVVAVAVFFCCK